MTQCGYIGIMGRPNVGKSTLLNQLIGQRISIICDKPQTTRHAILGVKTEKDVQMIFVDTPGLNTKNTSQLNRQMNKNALSVLEDVDLILLLIEAKEWTETDEWIAKKLTPYKKPIIICINKIDKLNNPNEILPRISKINDKLKELEIQAEIIPLSAAKKSNMDTLTKLITTNLPQSPHYFPADTLTNKSARFLAAEWIREQLMRHLGQEIPYGVTVTIEKFEDTDTIINIHALILVLRQSHKGIVIGKHGSMLKTIGQKARKTLEKELDKKVYLKLWTKVRENWINDELALKQLGLTQEND